MRNKRGIFFILAAASLWGTAGIFVRTLSNNGFESGNIVLLRSFMTILALGIMLVFKESSLFKIRLKDLPIFATSGIFSIVMFNFCYYKTMALSTLSVAAVLLYTAPFFVMLMSIPLFSERLTFRKIFACIFAFLGCLFVSGALGSSQHISLKCLVYGLLTGFGYSLYTVFGNILLKRGYDSITITFYTFVFALLGSLAVFEPISAVKQAAQNPEMLLVGLGMAVFNTVLPYIFYTNGLKTVEAGTAPIIATVEPVVATVVGILFYNEKLTLSGALGIALVLGSVIILNLKMGRKK